MEKPSDLKIFSGSSNRQLAEKISQILNIPLGELLLDRFSDGEIQIKIKENVRGQDIYIVQSTSYPANDHIMEIALLVDAFQRSSAKRINVVIPYFGYGRQDRKPEPRVPISAKVVSVIIERLGADRVLAMDLHADQIQGFFDIPVDHLYAVPVMLEYFQKIKISNPVVVAPDSGGTERARFFAKHFRANLAVIDKRRDKPNESTVMNVIGDVKDKDCILVDDIIDTAGTICSSALALKKRGANSIYVTATHAVLSGNAVKKLEESCIDTVIFTDTISIPDSKKIPKLKVLSVAPLMAEAIKRINQEASVSSLFL